MAQFTTVDHELRRKYTLTLNEYAICDSIYHLSRDQICTMSKENLGQFIGVTKQSVHKILNTLEKKKLIKRVSKNGLKTTHLWNKEIKDQHTDSKESLPSKNKDSKESLPHSKESLPEMVKKVDSNSKESLHNNNNINSNNNINNINIASDLDLYHKIEKSFHWGYEKQTNLKAFSNYGKEGNAIKQLIKKAQIQNKDDPEQYIKDAIHYYWELVNSNKRYFKDKPYLPSQLNGDWDQVITKIQKEKINEPDQEYLDFVANLNFGNRQ